MLKVVIADDEVRVCRLVQALADWDALGMEVVGTASNGLEALDLVEKFMPDILITDIRMPGCDGLELIEKAIGYSPRLEIVIISGYAQFEYAQTAIHHGVGSYLLKPIKKEALTATLEKMGERCRKRTASATTLEHLRQDRSKSHDLLRDRLLEDLLHKRLDAPTQEQLHNQYGFNVGDGQFQVFILKFDYDPKNFRGTSMTVIQKKVEEIFEPAIFPLCITGVLQFYRSAGYGILNFEPQKRDDIRRALRNCFNQLESQKYFFGAVEFSLAIGQAVDDAEALPISMYKAQGAISERLMEGTGRLFETVPPASQIRARQLLDKYNRAMDHAMDSLSADETDKAAEELRHSIEQASDVRGYELLDLVLSAGRLFVMRIDVEEEASLMQTLEESCELCGSADKLFDCLQSFQRSQIERILEERESEAIRPIRIAKQYIQQHFSEPITLEDVCAATGFSVSYFSALFKKETGEGFSKYLTRVRIERAKTILQDTNLSVAEICEQVGYSDLKHFTSTFKKVTSLNPGQYRKLYG